MTYQEFEIQLARLRQTFGKNAYDAAPRIEMIWDLVSDLTGAQFKSVADHFVSSSRHAPLPTDFKEAARAERKRAFDEEVKGAANSMHTPWSGSLQAYLARAFPGCKTLDEAVQVRKLQIKIAKAKDPTYDPMKDPAWQ